MSPKMKSRSRKIETLVLEQKASAKADAKIKDSNNFSVTVLHSNYPSIEVFIYSYSVMFSMSV